MLFTLFALSISEDSYEVSAGPPILCSYSVNTSAEIIFKSPFSHAYCVSYRIDPSTSEGIVRSYRTKLTERDLDLDWSVPLQSLPFAFRSIADNSLSTISLHSPGYYQFAFVDGSLCSDGVLNVATSSGISQFDFSTSPNGRSEYALFPGVQKCLFLMNPSETELNISTSLLPGDVIWLNSTANITGNQTVSVPRPPGGPPILMRFAIGADRGDRSIKLTVAAASGERERKCFLGMLRADEPVKRIVSESDHQEFVIGAVIAITCMGLGLVIVIVAGCGRYGWWAAWRAKREAARAEKMRESRKDIVLTKTSILQ
jgi:hypothetical protein